MLKDVFNPLCWKLSITHIYSWMANILHKWDDDHFSFNHGLVVTYSFWTRCQSESGAHFYGTVTNQRLLTRRERAGNASIVPQPITWRALILRPVKEELRERCELSCGQSASVLWSSARWMRNGVKCLYCPAANQRARFDHAAEP